MRVCLCKQITIIKTMDWWGFCLFVVFISANDLLVIPPKVLRQHWYGFAVQCRPSGVSEGPCGVHYVDQPAVHLPAPRLAVQR